MTKGHAGQVETTHAGESTQRGSHRRLKISHDQKEPVLLAFADALRDILHDELRATA